MKSQNQLVLSLEWTQPVLEVCTIIVVEHSVSENFEMKPSNEIVVKQEEDNSDEGDIVGRISETRSTDIQPVDVLPMVCQPSF